MTEQKFGEVDVRYLNHAALGLPNGGELYYDQRGDGPAITLVNNFYIVSPVWRNFTGELEKDHRIISFDLRNQGASSPGTGPVRFADHVEDIRRLLDHLEVEQTYLVGTSISTLIARDFAVAYPERVKGLILIGPAFSPNGGLRRKLTSRSWLASLEAGGTRGLFDHMYPLVFPDQLIHAGGTPAYLAIRDNFLSLLSVSSIRENLTASLDVPDDPETLANMRCPTLIMVGDGDFAWCPSVIEDALALMPNCQAVTLPRAGHVPYFDDPAGFQRAISDFVAAQEASSADGQGGQDSPADERGVAALEEAHK